MNILNLQPGKKIGKIKEKLREKQLSGEIQNKEDAKNFIKVK